MRHMWGVNVSKALRPAGGMPLLVAARANQPLANRAFSVTRATGLDLCPATGRKRNARRSTARITAASMVAKLAPIQTLDRPRTVGRRSASAPYFISVARTAASS
jgi:hypothetical protein